jgi:hypothetical protein
MVATATPKPPRPTHRQPRSAPGLTEEFDSGYLLADGGARRMAHGSRRSTTVMSRGRWAGGTMRALPGAQPVLGEVAARARPDGGRQPLPVLGIIDRLDPDLGDRRVLGQCGRDGTRIDVGPTRHDHVVDPAVQVQASVHVHVPEVAGGHLLSARQPADHVHLTDGPRRQQPALGVADAQPHAVGGPPHRPRRGLKVGRRGDRGPARLRGPVEIKHNISKLLYKLGVQLGRQRRGAAHDRPQPRRS